VTVTPAKVRVAAAESVQFKASISGSKADQEKGVSWKVAPSSEGRITSQGKYTADAQPKQESATVIATSVADPESFAKAILSIHRPSPKSPGNDEKTNSPDGPSPAKADGAKQIAKPAAEHAPATPGQDDNGNKGVTEKPADQRTPPAATGSSQEPELKQ
jgi:hypothetical protein